MSHYPGSAELAAFRRSLYRHDPMHTVTPFHEPADFAQGASIEHPHAWSVELAHGIGYRHSHDPRRTDIAWGALQTDSYRGRVEASALRSRAYARMLQEQDGTYARPWVPVAFVPPVLPMAWPEEVAYGAPYTYRARRDDYVPDGGWSASDYWDDELPRSPLPVTYNAPVTIHSDASA